MPDGTIAHETRAPIVGGVDVTAEGFNFREPTSYAGGGDNGGPNVVTAFEQEVQSLFRQLTPEFENDHAANTTNGWTFLDADQDGWYDHIERFDNQGI